MLLIRIVRYSLDGKVILDWCVRWVLIAPPGLVFSQVVFLAYMVVNKYTANIVFASVLIVCTVVVKIA